MRLGYYAGASAIAAAGALLKAFHQRPNFYSAVVYLSQSNACVLILANLALVCACTFMYGLQRFFFGTLRPIEVEQLWEKAWYAVLDTLLTIPTIRDDVDGWTVSIFVLLLGGKIWAWIADGRVDILEQQPPQNPRTFHARLSSSLLVSTFFDVLMLRYCIQSVMDNPRPGMMLIFTFEFAILSTSSTFTFTRYILALMEARITQLQAQAEIERRKAEIRAERERLTREAGDGPPPVSLPNEGDIDENELDVPGWEDKRRWLFVLEIITDFMKICVYTVFFTISLAFMGLPMHIMRDVWMTSHSFIKKLQDYANYRKATQDMNSRYQDATAEELANDNTCIVCRDSMVPWQQPNADDAPRSANATSERSRAKKLPCGHILHMRCLKDWLERQQTCPMCRAPVVPPTARNAQRTNAPLQPGVAQQPNGQPGAANQAPPAGPQAPRIQEFNLGPIRIALARGRLPPAAGGNLAQAAAQLHANHARDALNANNRQGQGAAQNDNAARGRALMRQMNPQRRRSLGRRDTEELLREAELRLAHDMRYLSLQQAQLATLHAWHTQTTNLRFQVQQLRREREQMANAIAQPNTATADPGNSETQPPGVQAHVDFQRYHAPFGGFVPNPAHPGYAYPQMYQPQPQQAPLTADHAELPQGFTLPEGWTLMPLHRVGQAPVQVRPPTAIPVFNPQVAVTAQAVPTNGVPASEQLLASEQALEASSTLDGMTQAESDQAHVVPGAPTEGPSNAAAAVENALSLEQPVSSSDTEPSGHSALQSQQRLADSGEASITANTPIEGSASSAAATTQNRSDMTQPGSSSNFNPLANTSPSFSFDALNVNDDSDAADGMSATARTDVQIAAARPGEAPSSIETGLAEYRRRERERSVAGASDGSADSADTSSESNGSFWTGSAEGAEGGPEARDKGKRPVRDVEMEEVEDEEAGN